MFFFPWEFIGFKTAENYADLYSSLPNRNFTYLTERRDWQFNDFFYDGGPLVVGLLRQ